jgi:hypothetical protein
MRRKSVKKRSVISFYSHLTILALAVHLSMHLPTKEPSTQGTGDAANVFIHKAFEPSIADPNYAESPVPESGSFSLPLASLTDPSSDPTSSPSKVDGPVLGYG